MTAYSRWKFTDLFGCLLLAALVHPFVVTHVDGKAAFVVAMTFFFSAAILSFTKNRWQLVAGVFLGVLAIAFRWWDLFVKGEKGIYLEIGGKVVEIAFLTLTVVMLMIAIFERREATFDSIFGAFAGYLMIALLWGLCYSTIEMTFPCAFNVTEPLRKDC